jgi:HEAT repeat protein
MSPDHQSRLRAVFALTRIRIVPDLFCVPALEGVLNDPDPHVRAQAT